MTNRPADRARPTLWDVAREAGVSHQTVSRYLRGEPRMREATRQKVREAVERLDYRPNLAARSMRTGRSMRLGILLPPASHGGIADVLSGAIDVANAGGYGVEIYSVDGTAERRHEKLLDIVDSGTVSGVLVLAPLPPESQDHHADGAVVVVSADYDDRARGIGELADGAPVVELMEHLHELGHRRFAHITGALGFASARGRRATFLETMERFGLEDPVVIEGGWSEEHGRRAVEAMDEATRPTAIIAGNDLAAAGAIAAATARGWRVPEDLSVTGWDNFPLSALLTPSLTTVDVDRRQLGSNGMDRLIAALEGREPQQSGTDLNTVIWRGSTGPAPQIGQG